MVSALLKKSFNDLKKRKARTVFTIITIALAVSALSMFAVMPLIDQGMEHEVEDSKLHNFRLFVNDLVINDTQLHELNDLDNINSVELKSVFYTRMYIGSRRNDALIIGVNDFNDQTVNVVILDSGRIPAANQLLSDSSNSRYDLYNGESGDNARIYDHQGGVQNLKISGKGHTLKYTVYPTYGVAVFYANMNTLHALSNTTGINILEFDLDKTGETDVENTIKATETYLEHNTAFTAFTDLPEIREEGDYPGKQEGRDFANFFYILTIITVFCSVFLISNTMHTIMTEQRRELAQMKAVGATKLQVMKGYLTTSLIMGGTGACIGGMLGVFIAYGLALNLANNFYGISLGFSIYLPTVLISILIGIGITIAATLPALYRGLRTTAREGMQDSGLTASYGNSKIDRALMKINFLPSSSQMGIRNITRKKGRSISTSLQVALAVGMFLAVVTFGHSISVMVEEEWDNLTFDILVAQSGEGGKYLTEDMRSVLEEIDGVSIAEPIVGTGIKLKENGLIVYGYQYNTVGFNIDGTVYKGRWYTKEEQQNNATVVVLSKTIAELENIDVGDTIDIAMATGLYQFKVIGLCKSQMNNGMSCYMPINTIQDKMLMGDKINGFVIKTTSRDHDDIDRVSTSIEDELLARGYVTECLIKYVAEEQNQQGNAQLIDLMIMVGALIILITMVGLMSTLTMNVVERTKEIGIMRCVGSSSRSVRAVFATEGLMLSLIGWGIGIPVGYAIARLLNYMVADLMHVQIVFLFPIQFVLVALVITMLITILIIQPPLFRATHLKPGDALRYE